MDDQRLKEVFKRAAEIARSVPRGLQEVAFNRALDGFLPAGAPQGRRRTAAGKTRRPSKKAEDHHETREKPRPKQRSGKAGRPGPKAAVEGLLSAGYFSKAKTIGEVQTELRDHRGHAYKLVELSPALVRLIRSEQLRRKKNQDGQYEYTAK
jgi:hypothetical protein